MTAAATPRGVPATVLVTVGDELLLGETVDTNAAWLAGRLTAMGLPVLRRLTVGDAPEEIGPAVDRALDRAELVVLTGGLGPTRDDVTRDAVAALLGRPLLEDPALVAELEARFRGFGWDRLPEPNRRQARVPEGARILPNAHGTAPGLWLEEARGLVVLLPGVPREMRGIFDDQLSGLLRKRFGTRIHPVVHRVIHTSGIAESALAERLERVLPRDTGPVSVAYLPDVTGVDLRLTARPGADPGEAASRLDRVAALVRDALEPWTFEASSGDLVESVVRRLRRAGATVAVAESCTGGWLAYRFVRTPGVSDGFLGGVVAYENRIKTELLGVAPGVIERYGAVSQEVVREMASGVAERTGTDAALSITGVAGPEGGSPAKPVGTVWIGAAYRGEVRTTHRRLPGDRIDVQARAAQEALRLLYGMLGDVSAP